MDDSDVRDDSGDIVDGGMVVGEIGIFRLCCECCEWSNCGGCDVCCKWCGCDCCICIMFGFPFAMFMRAPGPGPIGILPIGMLPIGLFSGIDICPLFFSACAFWLAAIGLPIGTGGAFKLFIPDSGLFPKRAPFGARFGEFIPKCGLELPVNSKRFKHFTVNEYLKCFGIELFGIICWGRVVAVYFVTEFEYERIPPIKLILADSLK